MAGRRSSYAPSHRHSLSCLSARPQALYLLSSFFGQFGPVRVLVCPPTLLQQAQRWTVQ